MRLNPEWKTFTARQAESFCLVVFAASLLISPGCITKGVLQETIRNDTSRVDCIASHVDNPQPRMDPAARIAKPFTPGNREDLANVNYQDVTLDYIISVAMQNDTVLRDLGGTILTNPEQVRTGFNSGLSETDPRFGMEAALSAFDAQLSATAYFDNVDRTFNNPFFAGGTNTLQQDKNDYTVELSKLTATGTRYALRNVTNYDSNNAPGNIFPNAWETYVEGEVRKPLLQGGGLQFNRIAGPGSTPGVYNGILVAKVSNDITQTEFETAVREYVSNVVNSYWDLYYAYRDFDAKTRAMNRALETWNRLKANEAEAGARVSLAAEQYFRLKADVDEALSGRLVQGTQVRNGSSGGTLRGTDGIQVAERRLRLLIGMSVADGSVLRPADEPEKAEVIFDWNTCSEEAVSRRPELRKQFLHVRQKEMELLAAKNFVNPRLDAVARYRYRGFGDDLVNQGGNQQGGTPASAIGNMFTGNLQEWHVGVEFSVPIGMRKAHLAVQNAELMLSRARTIHREQQKKVVHDIVNAIGDAERAYIAAENNLNRYLAAKEVVTAYETKDDANFELDAERLLDAQRRLMDAETEYFRSRAEYAVALKNVHFEKGSIMAYNNLDIYDGAVSLATSPEIYEENVVLARHDETEASSDESVELPPVDVSE